MPKQDNCIGQGSSRIGIIPNNHEYHGEINETWDNYFSGTALYERCKK